MLERMGIKNIKTVNIETPMSVVWLLKNLEAALSG
jgi:hypothetical protein